MRYARWINKKLRRGGHLCSNRFYSTVLDEPHLWTAVRYVEMNPVPARMAARGEDNPWSSCRAHCTLESGAAGLLDRDRPFPGNIGPTGWADYVNAILNEAEWGSVEAQHVDGKAVRRRGFC